MSNTAQTSGPNLAEASKRFQPPVRSEEERQAQRDADFDRTHSVESWVKNPRRIAALGAVAVALVASATIFNKPIHNLVDHVLGGQDRQAQANQQYLDQVVKPDVNAQLDSQGIHLTGGPLPPQTP
jgi:hypothetical protein